MSHEADFASVTRSEALLAEAEQLANLGSWEHDLESGLISRSANLCRMLGAEPSAKVIREDFFWNLVAPEDHESVRNTIDRATANRESYEYQARFILPDGSNRTFLTRGKPIIDSTNRVVKRIGVALDITERAESAVALEKSEERYRDLVENSRDLICTHDLDGRLLSMNELPAKLLGYCPEELIGRRLPEMLCPKYRGEFDDYMERIQREGSAQGLMVLVTSSGDRRMWEYHNTLRGTGILTPIVRCIAHDVTEHMEAERNLRKNESLLGQAEVLANMGCWELDVETQTLSWSSHFFRLLGLEPELGPVPTDRAEQMIHPDDRERALHDIEQVLTCGLPLDNVLRFIRDDGKVRFFYSRGVGLTDGTGRVVRVRGMSQDITNKMQVEEDLHRLSRELMRARDRERRKIARDLHESVGQSLAALKMSLGRMGDTLPDENTQARAFLKSAFELAENAVREVRTISYLMHPPTLDDLGLGSALRWYTRGFGERSGIKLNVEIADDLERQTQEVETAIFRIVQEALTNVHRYSGTQVVAVRLAHANGYITVEVQDYGCGIPFNGFSHRSRGLTGVGIQGMRERVKELKGVFEIESVAGKGTTLRVMLPCAPANPWKKDIDSKRASKPDANLNLQAKRASG